MKAMLKIFGVIVCLLTISSYSLPAFSQEAYQFILMIPPPEKFWYFPSPVGVAVDSSGNVYITDSSDNLIQKFDSNGNHITKWGSFGSGNGQFYGPDGVAVDSAGNVYVADTANHRIQKFDSNGNFITKWGSFGSGDGQFYYPRGGSSRLSRERVCH